MTAHVPKIAFLIVSILLIVSKSKSQEYFSKELKPIKENFKRLNSIKEWTKISEVDLEESAEGGVAKFYFLDTVPRKVIVRHFGETFQTITEYYLFKGQLSFVLDRKYKYNRPITWDSTKMEEYGDNQVWNIKKAELEENRSYFKNGKLIHQINNQDCGSPFSNEYLKTEGLQIIKEFRKYFNLLASNK